MSGATVYEGDVGEEQLLDGGAVGQRLDHLGQTNISTPILAEVSKMERNNNIMSLISRYLKMVLDTQKTHKITEIYN